MKLPAVGTGEGEVLGCAGEGPGVVVQGVMVVVTQQHQFVEIGEPAPGRELSEVMRFAPARWSVAARMSTPAVAGDQREVLLW